MDKILIGLVDGLVVVKKTGVVDVVMDGGQQLMDVVAVEVVGQADIKIDVAANRQGLAVEGCQIMHVGAEIKGQAVFIIGHGATKIGKQNRLVFGRDQIVVEVKTAVNGPSFGQKQKTGQIGELGGAQIGNLIFLRNIAVVDQAGVFIGDRLTILLRLVKKILVQQQIVVGVVLIGQYQPLQAVVQLLLRCGNNGLITWRVGQFQPFFVKIGSDNDFQRVVLLDLVDQIICVNQISYHRHGLYLLGFAKILRIPDKYNRFRGDCK